MSFYSVVLKDSIEREKKQTDYIYSKEERKLLDDLFEEVNEFLNTDFHYLAELDAYQLKGVSTILKRYITKFCSENIRSILMWQIVHDSPKNNEELVLDMYMHFKKSEEYISQQGKPAPAHIYARYDNAIKKLKPKNSKELLLCLAKNPRDFYYLPFTMQMLASWKIPKMKEILREYLDGNNTTPESVGLVSDEMNVFPSLNTIKRGNKFTALSGLKYYPSEETVSFLCNFLEDEDEDIRVAAKKVIKKIEHSSIGRD